MLSSGILLSGRKQVMRLSLSKPTCVYVKMARASNVSLSCTNRNNLRIVVGSSKNGLVSSQQKSEKFLNTAQDTYDINK